MDLSFVGEAPDIELEELVGQMHALGCTAHRALLRAVAEMDDREAWKADGARSMADWLCLRLGLTRRSALRWVEVAHALETLPLIAAAYAEGRLGFERVSALVELATPATEAALLETTAGTGTAALEAAARRSRGRTPAEAAEAEWGATCSSAGTTAGG